MHNPLWAIISRGRLTQREVCPDLPEDASGLPTVTATPCAGPGCDRCAAACPTQALTLTADEKGGVVTLDRGRCVGCQACVEACPSQTLIPDRSTRTAVRTRAELVLTNRPITAPAPAAPPPASLFERSLSVREVSTGSNATDLEVLATTNAVFDVARFGISYVASPRFADALLVTGPVGKAMQEPLRRCYDAMAEPRLVIAAGTDAISGGLHAGGYAEANGLGDLLPVDCFIPGDPPHPWSLLHGLLLTMGREVR
ncbi:MAG: 4Fe-4S dicluster domain-containing protein [Armatimonadota bacterium]